MEPIIPNIVTGIHEAFSLAIASIFLIGVVTTIGALIVAVFVRELPLRTHHGAAPPPMAE